MANARTATPGLVRSSKNGVLLTLRVSLGARETSVKGTYGESAFKLSLAAPPVDGRANAEVERYPSKLFCAAPSDVMVVRGASSRDKTILVRGGQEDEVLRRLRSLL